MKTNKKKNTKKNVEDSTTLNANKQCQKWTLWGSKGDIFIVIGNKK